MLRQFAEMFLCAAGENSTVDGGMQRLDAAVEKFREAGKSLGGRDGQAPRRRVGRRCRRWRSTRRRHHEASAQRERDRSCLKRRSVRAGLTWRCSFWNATVFGKQKRQSEKTQLPQPRRSTVHKGKLFPGGSSPLWYLSTHAKCVHFCRFPSQMNPSARQSRSPSLFGLYASTEEGAGQGSPTPDAAAVLPDFCRFRAAGHGPLTKCRLLTGVTKKCSDPPAVCYTMQVFG